MQEIVKRGTLSSDVPVSSQDEVGRLALAFNKMIQELRSRVNHSGNATGMPRMALSGGEIVFAWTIAGDEKPVVTARVKLSEL